MGQAHPDLRRLLYRLDPQPVAGALACALFALRRTNRALRDGTTVDLSTDDVIAFRRTSAKDEALVLANVRDHPAKLSIPKGEWRDAFTTLPVDSRSTDTLPAFGYRVLLRSVP